MILISSRQNGHGVPCAYEGVCVADDSANSADSADSDAGGSAESALMGKAYITHFQEDAAALRPYNDDRS
jgi:hypothetical protein